MKKAIRAFAICFLAGLAIVGLAFPIVYELVTENIDYLVAKYLVWGIL